MRQSVMKQKRKEVVVKRGEYKENPQSGKVQLVYNEHVELIEVPIKPSDRLKAREMLGKYHKLFTDKHDINGNVPIFINIGEWDGGDEGLDKAVKDVSNDNPNHTVIVDDIPLEDYESIRFYKLGIYFMVLPVFIDSIG